MRAVSTFVLVGILLSTLDGCSRNKRLSPEAFFASLDLKAVAESCVPAGTQWADTPAYETHDNRKFFIGMCNCNPSGLEAVAESIKKELVKLIEKNGAKPTVSPLPDPMAGIARGHLG